MGAVRVYVDDNHNKISKSAWKNAGSKKENKLTEKLMQGQIYLYNNTILNNFVDDNKIGYGGIGTSIRKNGTYSNRIMRNITTRNNILHVLDEMNSISIGHDESNASTEDYGYDMVSSEKVPDAFDQSTLPNEEHTPIIPHYTNQFKLPTLDNGLKGNFKIDNSFSADNTIDNFTQGRANVGAHDETEDYDIEYGREANVTKYIK